jgi:predicted nucleic acid-binding protein
MKGYLDNNVVSSLGRDDTPDQSFALDRLLDAYDQGKIALVTSELTLQEIQSYNGTGRPQVERIYRLLQKVPIVRWDELLGIHSFGDQYSWINSPMIQNDPLYDSLLRLNLDPKPTDARHVFVAAQQHCDVFLTCDKNVLKHKDAIQQLCSGLTAQRPSELVSSMGW